MEKEQVGFSTFTVIIPCFNGEAFVARSIDSVLKQTYQDLCLIVVDDGSTDNSAEIIRGYQDPRINLIQQENKGVSAARNYGAKIARSPWIAFLDADDEWKDTFLQEVFEAINVFSNQKDVVAVFTDYTSMPAVSTGLNHLAQEPIFIDDYFRFVLAHRRSMSSSSAVVRRSILLSVGGFPVGVTHGEDVDTWTRLGWSGKFICIPKPLAIYHTSNVGSATKMPLKYRTATPQLWFSYKEWSMDNRIPSNQFNTSERYIAHRMFWHIIDLIDIGQKKEARFFANKIIRMESPTLMKYLLNFFLYAPGRSGIFVWKVADKVRRYLNNWGIRLRLKV